MTATEKRPCGGQLLDGGPADLYCEHGWLCGELHRALEGLELERPAPLTRQVVEDRLHQAIRQSHRELENMSSREMAEYLAACIYNPVHEVTHDG